MPIQFPLPKNYFDGGAHVTDESPGSLREILNSNQANPLTGETPTTETTAQLDIYCDALAGSDNNSGLLASEPVRSLDVAFALIPTIVKHSVVVHLSGTFAEFGEVSLKKDLQGGNVIIDGGYTRSIVTGPFTSTATSTTQISDSGQSWGADAYKGYWVEILDGVALGEVRQVFRSAATDIDPGKDFSIDPGVGATFQIVKPATILSASSTTSSIVVECYGSGYAVLQRLTLAGTKIGVKHLSGFMDMAHVVIEGKNDTDPVVQSLPSSGMVGLLSTRFASDGSAESASGAHVTGVSQIESTSRIELQCYALREASGLIARQLNLYSTQHPLIKEGSRITEMEMVNSLPSSGDQSGMEATSGFRPCEIDGGGGVGALRIKTSYFKINTGCVIQNATNNGIEVDNSTLIIDGVVSGVNGTFGVYAHSNSIVKIDGGNIPTFDGATGDFTTDDSSQLGTWTSVVSVIQSDPNELTLFKLI